MMNAKERAKFRTTKEWKEFREYMKEKYDGKDAITGEKLRKGWNLHHMDLDSSHYTNLDENMFIPLNMGTHDKLHKMYVFSANQERLEKLFEYIEKMRKINVVQQRRKSSTEKVERRAKKNKASEKDAAN